jgi:hypothetical protein
LAAVGAADFDAAWGGPRHKSETQSVEVIGYLLKHGQRVLTRQTKP